LEFDKPDRKLQQANEQTNETTDSHDRQQHMQTTTTTTPILYLCVSLSHTQQQQKSILSLSLSLSLSTKSLGHTVLGGYLIFLTSGFRFSNWLVGEF